ncbi:MAG: hypothetical protein WAV50_03775 [Minisyncoccia bacterium]
MLYSKDSTVEDRIVELSTETRSTIKSLHETLTKEQDLTLRAVYKTVHKLIDAGVLLKAGRHVVVDQEWARRAAGALGSAAGPALSVGERAAYTFASVEHLDSFWKTVVLPLEQTVRTHETFFYNPHNFWAYLPARKESEDAYYRHFSGQKYGFFTIGGESAADREFKRAYQNDHLQIDLRDVGQFRKTDHITILDSFIITVRLKKSMSDRIDRLYSTDKSMDEILPDIAAICNKPGKIRFVLENNPSKASGLRRVLAKNFYVQQATRLSPR